VGSSVTRLGRANRWLVADTEGVVPDAVNSRLAAYLTAIREAVPAQVAAVYGVGALALGDFSVRQSNIDLVVVAEARLDAAQLGRLTGAVRGLRRVGRPAEIWHVTWEDLGAQGPGSGGPDLSTQDPPLSSLATPMTRAILRHDPMTLFGPDWPVVGYDPTTLREWAAGRLRTLVSADHGPLVFRRAVAPLVLEAARLTQAAIDGRILSKSEAGEAVMSIVSSRHQRLLTDAVGYRRGAQASMYWGPFERKYDAQTILRELVDAATAGETGPA
jgi:hypothetical protein